MMKSPYSTIPAMPDFDIEFPDEFVDEYTATEELQAHAHAVFDDETEATVDKILGIDNTYCDCFYCQDDDDESEHPVDDWST